jgi:hypothetical protein
MGHRTSEGRLTIRSLSKATISTRLLFMIFKAGDTLCARKNWKIVLVFQSVSLPEYLFRILKKIGKDSENK